MTKEKLRPYMNLDDAILAVCWLAEERGLSRDAELKHALDGIGDFLRSLRPESAPGEAEAEVEAALNVIEEERRNPYNDLLPSDASARCDAFDGAAATARSALRAAAGPDAETRRKAWEALERMRGAALQPIVAQSDAGKRLVEKDTALVRAGLYPEEGGS